jgi:hypothetical protein
MIPVPKPDADYSRESSDPNKAIGELKRTLGNFLDSSLFDLRLLDSVMHIVQ